MSINDWKINVWLCDGTLAWLSSRATWRLANWRFRWTRVISSWNTWQFSLIFSSRCTSTLLQSWQSPKGIRLLRSMPVAHSFMTLESSWLSQSPDAHHSQLPPLMLHIKTHIEMDSAYKWFKGALIGFIWTSVPISPWCSRESWLMARRQQYVCVPKGGPVFSYLSGD